MPGVLVYQAVATGKEDVKQAVRNRLEVKKSRLVSGHVIGKTGVLLD